MHNKVLACARRRGAALVAALALAAAGAAAQSAAPAKPKDEPAKPQEAPTEPPAAPTKSKEEPTAADILDRAIARQGTPKGIDPAVPRPLALSAKTNLQFRDDKGNDISLDAERRFLAPDRVWTQLTDKATGTVTRSGWDGKRPWFQSDRTPVKYIDGPENADDQKQLSTDVEITSALARALQLRQLKTELKELRRLDDGEHLGAKLWVVEGDTLVDMDRKKTPTKVRLFLNQADAQLAGVRVAFEGRDPLQIWFAKQQVVDGFEFPHKVEVFRKDASRPQVTIFVTALDLAPHLTDADFAPPKADK